MLQFIFKLLKPLLVRFATNFLNEDDVANRLDRLIESKIEKLSSCNIGRRLGINRNSSISDVPLTGYDYYHPFYENPQEGDFIYPLEKYVRAHTSGTMGKPKIFLVPQPGLSENVKKSCMSLLFICTHDGEKPTLEIGDTIYVNLPGGEFLGAQAANMYKKRSASRVLRVVPEHAESLSFQGKVDYFIQNHKKIDIAYMTITTFLDEIYPNVAEPISLKAFLNTDSSAVPFKEDIYERCGSYPSTFFASTETMLIGLPSIEHPGAFFFDWRSVYPEFIPGKESINTDITRIEDPPETVSLMDVKPGERYQLIATPLINDLIRYVMPDVFECIDKGDDVLGIDLPVFKYYARADKLLVLHNFTRISEEELITILKNADIPFVDFTVRRELMGHKEYMSIYIELNKDIPKTEVYNRINKELLEFDKDWRDLSNFMNYTPLKINILPRNTFKNFLHHKRGMPRFARLGMREEHFKTLLDYAEDE